MTRHLPLLLRRVAGTLALALAVAMPLAAQAADTAGQAAPPQADSVTAVVGGPIIDAIDRVFGAVIVTPLSAVFFYDVMFWDNASETNLQLPLVVLWLVLGSVFLTIKMGFINLRAFRHAINVTRGKYSNPADVGEVSHFQALTTALSATVGLGNIAGVAIAVSIGGPGATFWMIIAGLIGMSAKFAECTLGQKYRVTRSDGHVMGGAMYYLSNGLAEMGWARMGKVLAVLFAILCIGGSLGGGNTFQVSQSMNALQESMPFLVAYPWIYGLAMSLLVGVVIIGGIKRIAEVADKIVPSMVAIYMLAAIFILFDNFSVIPTAFGSILDGAFSPGAAYGGFIGVLVQGFRRAAFSNEAGAGSAAIAHSAARTAYPVREGIVALLEPFIDTVVVCTMTALVIVITGAYSDPNNATLIATSNGAALTSRAFGQHISWFPYILGICVLLFAFSTMISWSYYGERCWTYLVGDGKSRIFQFVFVLFTFLGSVVSATNILNFGDLMILGMAFPNLVGVLMLSGKVKADLGAYWAMYKAGQFQVYK